MPKGAEARDEGRVNADLPGEDWKARKNNGKKWKYDVLICIKILQGVLLQNVKIFRGKKLA